MPNDALPTTRKAAMKLTRNTTRVIHFFLDQCLPPWLRDQRWFMWLPFRILFKEKAAFFLDFKDTAANLSSSDLQALYQQLLPYHLARETDLNNACLNEIQNNIVGETVLDAGCGRAFLSDLLSTHYDVTALDMIIAPDLISRYPCVHFTTGDLASLPFPDAAFDTVICAHTLEHIPNILKALQELRRVTKKRLIIIVPKQRPYRYTFDLHVHFFPYAMTLLNTLSAYREGNSDQLRDISDDWFYLEDKKT